MYFSKDLFSIHEKSILRRLELYNENVMVIAKSFDFLLSILSLPTDKVPDEIKGYHENCYLGIIRKLCWFTEEGTYALDAFSEYLRSLKTQQVKLAKQHYPNVERAFVWQQYALDIDFTEINYIYNGKVRSFLDFGVSNYSIYISGANPEYPNGCIVLNGFTFYSFRRKDSICFNNVIFNNCFIVDSYFKFVMKNCKVNGMIVKDSTINILRVNSNLFKSIKFIGRCKIEKLDLEESKDNLHKEFGIEITFTEPTYFDISKEAIYCYAYRFNLVKSIGKYFTIKNINLFRALHTGNQVIPMFGGNFKRPYTDLGEEFNPNFKLNSNLSFIRYVKWFKLYNKKTKEIYSNKSHISAFLRLIEVLVTGSWKSFKYILYSANIIVLLFATIYSLFKDSYREVDGFTSALYFSYRHFLNVGSGDIGAINTVSKYIVGLEGVTGYLFLGLLLFYMTKISDGDY